MVPDAASAFHAYAIEWDAERIRFFVDEKAYYTVEKKPGDGRAELPFDQPFYLILNVAMGGDFGSRVKILYTEALAAALARKAGRPVRIRLDRREEFAATKRRYPFDVGVSLTARRDGRVTALGVDAFEILPFTRELASLEPEVFVDRHLVAPHAPAVLVVAGVL